MKYSEDEQGLSANDYFNRTIQDKSCPVSDMEKVSISGTFYFQIWLQTGITQFNKWHMS
jgi:hypothetical protein